MKRKLLDIGLPWIAFLFLLWVMSLQGCAHWRRLSGPDTFNAALGVGSLAVAASMLWPRRRSRE